MARYFDSAPPGAGVWVGPGRGGSRSMLLIVSPRRLNFNSMAGRASATRNLLDCLHKYKECCL